MFVEWAGVTAGFAGGVHRDHRDRDYFVLKVVRSSEREGDSRGGNPRQRNHAEPFQKGNFKEGRTVYKRGSIALLWRQ